MLKLKELELENFLVFKDLQKIDFTKINYPILITGQNKLEFIKNNKEVLYGSNGAGKTSLISAIPFCFFNYSEKLNLDDLINNNSKKNLYVRLVFNLFDKDYTIFKFRKHNKFKNQTFLLEGNKSLTDLIEYYNNNSVVQSVNYIDIINNLIKINEKIFYQTIYFSQKKLTNFFEKSKTERYKVFELILNTFEIFDKIKENAKEKINFLENEINKKVYLFNNLEEQKNKIIEEYKNLYNELKIFKEKKDKIIEEIDNKIKLLPSEKEIKEKLKEIEEINTKYEFLIVKQKERENLINSYNIKKNELEKKIEEYKIYNKDEFDKYKNELNELNNNLQNKINEIKNLQKEFDLNNNNINLLKNNLTQINKILDNYLNQEKELINNIEKTENLIKDLENDKGQVCFFCGQKINLSHKDKILENLIQYQEKLKKIQIEINANKTKEIELNSNIVNLEEKNNNLYKQINDILNQSKNLENDIKNLNNKYKIYININNIEEIFSKQNELLLNLKILTENYNLTLEKLNKEIDELNNFYELKKDLLNKKEELLNNLVLFEKYNKEKEIIELNYNNLIKQHNLKKQEKEELEKKIETITLELKDYDYDKQNYEFWYKNIDTIKREIINKIINFFNEKLNFLLTFLFNQNIKILFDENFDYKIYFNNNIYDNINFLSGGEERRINIACNLALFLMFREFFNVNFNILIFDEILDINLDSLGIKGMLNIIEYLTKLNLDIIIISHKEDYITYFNNNFIKIVKDNENNSQIIINY